MREFITPFTMEMLVLGPRRVTSKSESSLRTGGGAVRAPETVTVKRKRSSTCPDLGEISDVTDTSAIPIVVEKRNRIIVTSVRRTREPTVERGLTTFIVSGSPWNYYLRLQGVSRWHLYDATTRYQVYRLRAAFTMFAPPSLDAPVLF